jgi:hypothetical protein
MLRWGQGGGYRNDVADIVRRWFEETVELQDARKSVDKSLQQAWREVVLQPLIDASRVDTDKEFRLDAGSGFRSSMPIAWFTGC